MIIKKGQLLGEVACENNRYTPSKSVAFKKPRISQMSQHNVVLTSLRPSNA